MAKVKLDMLFKDGNGAQFKKLLSYVDPRADKQTLKTFVNKLAALTTNDLASVMKVVENFLDESSEEYISVEDILDILDGNFTPIPDDDPIADADIDNILNESFTPVDDDDPINPDDFVF